MDALTWLELFARIVFAALLGGLVGFEREYIIRPAGLRTHMLVCVGSALVMVVSIAISMNGHPEIDITRIGAQVVSGIGFLGAGTIIKEGATVKGLTTAASLWAISCVGIAAGAGYYLIAGSTTVMLLVVLRLMYRTELRIKSGTDAFVVETRNETFNTQDLADYLSQQGHEIMEMRLVERHGMTSLVRIELHFPRHKKRNTSRRDEFEDLMAQYPSVGNIYDA